MSSTVSAQAPTGPSSYIERALRVSFILGEGDFGEKGQNTVTVDGLRMHASIQLFGYPSMNKAECRIYGLTPDIMNKVSVLGVPNWQIRYNYMTIEAGDARNGMNMVFRGQLRECWQDFNGQPDTALDVISFGGIPFDQAKPAPPLSVNGPGDVGTLMAGLANRMNKKFENNGVNLIVSNVYLAGTAWEQAKELARMADIEVYSDETKTDGVLAIWPKNGSRGGAIPVISPESGLIGYPRFSQTGINFRCLFNPNIVFGGQIEMKSSLTAANKKWFVGSLNYDLSSQIPGGPWFCNVGGTFLASQAPK